MPRVRSKPSSGRLKDLVLAALHVLSRQGYQRSQVADVAKAMGVAPGTIYLYVEGKEALFDLVIRHTAAENPDWLDTLPIPVPNPAPGSTLDFLRRVLDRKGQWPLLEAALRTRTAPCLRSELGGIIREQYHLMTRHRDGLVLLTRSALEFPGLAEVFVLGLRARLLDGLTRYLNLRIRSGQIRPLHDAAATAAVLAQTIAWANLQRPFDPGLSAFTEHAIEEATVDLLVSGLLPLPPSA